MELVVAYCRGCEWGTATRTLAAAERAAVQHSGAKRGETLRLIHIIDFIAVNVDQGAQRSATVTGQS